MIDFERLWQCLSEIGLGTWRASLEPLLHDRFTPAGHGDLPRWRDALAALRETPEGDPARIREQLLALAPWRKGPFEVFGIEITLELSRCSQPALRPVQRSGGGGGWPGSPSSQRSTS